MKHLYSKPLFSLTVGEYQELNKEILSEEISRFLENQAELNAPKYDNDIIFIDEVLEITGYKKATVYSKTSRKEMPILSRRKPLAFSRTEILDWLANGKPKPS